MIKDRQSQRPWPKNYYFLQTNRIFGIDLKRHYPDYNSARDEYLMARRGKKGETIREMRRVNKRKIEEEKFQCPIEREILSLIVVVVFLSLKFPPFYFCSYFYYFQCNNTLLNYFAILCDFFRFFISFHNLLCCLLSILLFHICVEFSYPYICCL